MFLKDKIIGVSKFAVLENRVGLIQNESFNLYEEGNFIDIDKPKISRSVFSIQNAFFVSDLSELKTVIYQKDNSRINLNYLCSLPFSIEQRQSSNYVFPIVRYNNKNEIGQLNRLNFKLEKTFPLNIGLNGVWKIINDSLFISKTEELISVQSFEDINDSWKKKYSELLNGERIEQFGDIIAHKEKLYIYLADNANSKNTATVSINIQSGNLEALYQQFAGNLTLYNNKIYVANATEIKTLDLKTNEIKKYDLTNTLSKVGLEIYWNSFRISDDKLFFVSGHSMPTNKLGVVDLETLELIWHKELDIEDDINKNIQEIKVVENKLFVHCSDQSLHIFEKE